MLTVETIGRIRREHFIRQDDQGGSRGTLGCPGTRSGRCCDRGRHRSKYERSVQRRPKLGRWAADLEGPLPSNAMKPAASN